MADPVRGFAFPFRIEGGAVAAREGAAKIRQNIMVLLATRLGERTMLRNFGTRVASLVHDPNDDVLADIIRTEVTEAILLWEPRVLVSEARVERNEGMLRLFVTYAVLAEGRAERMVIPLG
jgi:phage baseplate assembly protein W